MGFRDGKSGLEQCALCQNPTRYSGDVDENTAYCSYACTNGYSYQALSEGCISCTDKTPHKISGDAVSKAQCLACGDDMFWFYAASGSYVCASKNSCSENQYQETNNEGKCIPCDGTASYYVQPKFGYVSSNIGVSYFIDLCNNNCKGKRTARLFDGNNMYCVNNCQQPEGAPETCTDPANCNRVWQNRYSKCLPCDDLTNDNYIYTADTVAQELCVACGRKLVNNSNMLYCVYEQNCDGQVMYNGKLTNQFRGKDGKCYPCTQKNAVAIDENDTQCESHCKDENGTLIRKKYLYSSGITYCQFDCVYPEVITGGGGCMNCNSTNSTFQTLTEDECKECKNRMVFKGWGTYCSLKECPSDKKYFRSRYGECLDCSRENNSNDDIIIGDSAAFAKEQCEACGNRMVIHIDYDECYKVDPGKSGICSSLDGPLPESLDSDLKEKAQAYIDGKYDGQLFRGNDGKCYSCSDKTVSPGTTAEQCSSCGNRRMSNWACQYGKCEATKQFLGANNNCYDCTQKNISVKPNEENLCSSCNNRREMTLGNASLDTLTGKCVEECTPGLWQDSNGNCLLCGEGGNRAIGTDSESVRLCNTCDNREAVATTDSDGNITGYTCKVKI